VIVLAESNFVLELALQQEELAEADRLVAMAEAREIELVIPACALFEPYETLVRRRKARAALLERLRGELRQLTRSRAFAHLAESSRSVTGALFESVGLEAKGLEETIRRLLKCSVVTPLSAMLIESALDVQSKFQLQPQDAIVLASVVGHARERASEPKVFINKNEGDFLTPKIESYLELLNCRLLSKFSTGRQFVESHARRSAG
jgi:predicted nucleic acid-binding protein